MLIMTAIMGWRMRIMSPTRAAIPGRAASAGFRGLLREALARMTNHGANMFHGNSAHELGYANSAVLVALLRTLVREKVLTQGMAENVLRDGIKILEPNQSNISVSRAIEFIRTSLAGALTSKQSDQAA
jgi:hypothetical protein